mmetsp:Transcript_151616/g.486515  ORF Transcript_151616/g.486515 Transcript_151616/m.486515 type:complete len:251 (+) Transcript_151616:113-865(+)
MQASARTSKLMSMWLFCMTCTLCAILAATKTRHGCNANRSVKSQRSASSASSLMREALRSLINIQAKAVIRTTAASKAIHQSWDRAAFRPPGRTTAVLTTSAQSARPTTVQQALCQVLPSKMSSQRRSRDRSLSRSAKVERNAAEASNEHETQYTKYGRCNLSKSTQCFTCSVQWRPPLSGSPTSTSGASRPCQRHSAYSGLGIISSDGTLRVGQEDQAIQKVPVQRTANGSPSGYLCRSESGLSRGKFA